MTDIQHIDTNEVSSYSGGNHINGDGIVTRVSHRTADIFLMVDITSPQLPEIEIPFRSTFNELPDLPETLMNIPVIGKPDENDLFDLDFTGECFKTLEDKPLLAKDIPNPIKDTAALMTGLEKIKNGLKSILPSFFQMSSEEQGEVMTGIIEQEVNWDRMKLQDIIIDKKEVSMWSELLNSTKRSDLIPQKTVEKLERGEIVELLIKGFESFRIIKIRTRDKEGYAMSVIEFEIKDPRNKDVKNKKFITVKSSYLMRLPLLEGGTLSLLNNKMECIESHTIQRIFLSKQQGGLLKEFFKLLS